MYRVYKMFTTIFPDAQGDISQTGNNSNQLYLVLLNSKSSDFYNICWLNRITCENWYNVSHTSWYMCVCVLIYPVTAGAIYYLTTDQDQQDQPTTPQRSFSSAQFSIYRQKLVETAFSNTCNTYTYCTSCHHPVCGTCWHILHSASYSVIWNSHFPFTFFFFLCVSDISEVSAHTFQGVATSHSASPCLLQARLLLLKWERSSPRLTGFEDPTDSGKMR